VRNAFVMVIGLAAMLSLPATARAQDDVAVQGRWSLSIRGGADLPLGGDVHAGGVGTVLGLPTTVNARGYGDVYGTAFRSEAQLGYGVSDRVELFLGGAYQKKSADRLQVGDVAGLSLNAQFADYDEIGIEAGMRYFLAPWSSLKPYVTVMGGARFLEANSPTFTVPAASVTLSDVPFYDSSTVGTVAAGAGLRYDLSRSFGLGVETVARYQGKPDNLVTLSGTGLESINEAGDRWSMPVLFTVTARF